MSERKPHRNAEAIKAWADGADIQFKRGSTWAAYDNSDGLPDFDFGIWRVKPEPVVVEKYIWLDPAYNETRMSVSSSPNVRFTFDPDTKELVNVEVFR